MAKSDLIIKKNVASFREKAGLSPSEPVNLHPLLLKLNIITVFKPLSDTFSGMALKLNDKMFILINCLHPIGRQNFTIGHELYHLYEQSNFFPHNCKAGQFNKEDKEEYLADIFSANLLMPEDSLLLMIPEKELGLNKIQIGTILQIEQVFSVSHLALLYRLLNIGLVTKDFIEENKTDVIKTAHSLGFETSLYKAGNENLILGDYGMIANSLFKDSKISEGHFLELMDAYSHDKEF